MQTDNIETTKTVHTCCQICEQMCGLSVQVKNGKVERIDPDKDNKHNWKDYCVKGAVSHLALDHPLRIRRPMKRVGDKYVEASYQEAIADISQRLKTIMERHGPNAVGSYFGNPGGFSFGAVSFFNMMMQGIGTRNQFYSGSVDQNALNVVFEKMFGSGWTALNRDIDSCECFLLIGTNPAISALNWQGHVANGWRRILSAKKAGAQLIVVDPRRTETAAKATLHVTPLPETDWAFLLGLVKVIFDRGWENAERFVFSTGIDTLRELVQKVSLDDLSKRCDVPVDVIEQVAESFAKSPTAMAMAATGVSQGRTGTLAVWLSTVLNLITDRIESKGGLYYAENALLSLLEISDTVMPDSPKTSRLRGTPSILGYLPIAELADEITTPGEGQVRALFIHGGNPVSTGPDGNALSAAMEQLELLVCCDLFQRESHRNADWLIPAVHMLEREELHMLIHSLNPGPWAQFSRQVVAPPEGLIPEWIFYRDLALAMDVPIMAGKRWLNPLIRASRWYARITGNPDNGFSPRFLSWMMMKNSKSGISWKDAVNAEHGVSGPSKPIAEGSLFRLLKTPDGKVAAAPPEFISMLNQNLAEPAERASRGDYPLQLITRRSMHLMNSSLHESSATQLKKPLGDTVELNPVDAERYGVSEGQQVQVVSPTASVIATAVVSTAVRSGVATMAHGWGGKTFDPKGGRAQDHGGVNRNLLISNRDLDPLSFTPRLNGTEIRIEPLRS